jgi:hypothetical protein
LKPFRNELAAILWIEASTKLSLSDRYALLNSDKLAEPNICSALTTAADDVALPLLDEVATTTTTIRVTASERYVLQLHEKPMKLTRQQVRLLPLIP